MTEPSATTPHRLRKSAQNREVPFSTELSEIGVAGAGSPA
jgi:hypothetical protein